MMKKRISLLCLAALLLFAACASAQTLPDNSLFSPGLLKLSERMAQQPAVSAEAEVTVDEAFYARDLSVLSSMLEGTVFRYAGDASGEKLTIERGENVLGSYALADGSMIVNGRRYALEPDRGALEQMTGLTIAGEKTAQAAFAQLADKAVLERVPLSAVAGFLEGLSAGDKLLFGFEVTEAITLERTMSDDGTRLTRVDFRSGAIARAGEAPYAITGYMRQPAGRAPKDTFELVFTQDDKNFVELSYSALRENAVAAKNKKGEASVRTQLKFAGKVNGSAISSRLTVNMTNAWAADGDALNEKVTVSATLTHQDNTPGRRMQRLNQAQIKLRNVIRMTTHESGDEVIGLTDEMTLEAVMDENAFLTAGAKVSMEIGADVAPAVSAQEAALPLETASLDAAMGEAVRDLAAAVYRTLEGTALETVGKGL